MLAPRTKVVRAPGIGPRRDHGCVGGSGVRGAEGDPPLEVGDDRGRQPAIRRHLDRALVAKHLDEQAVIGRARHDDRAAVATGPEPLGVDQGEPGADPFRISAVALIAALDQDWPDFRLEMLEIFWGKFLGLRRRSSASDQEREQSKGAADHWVPHSIERRRYPRPADRPRSLARPERSWSDLADI